MKRDEFVDYCVFSGCPYVPTYNEPRQCQTHADSQTRIYEIANRKEMIVLVMQNMEA
jgi:hypothetical protein